MSGAATLAVPQPAAPRRVKRYKNAGNFVGFRGKIGAKMVIFVVFSGKKWGKIGAKMRISVVFIGK